MARHGPLDPLKSAARCVLRPQLAEGQQLLAITATVAAVAMATERDAADNATHLHPLC